MKVNQGTATRVHTHTRARTHTHTHTQTDVEPSQFVIRCNRELPINSSVKNPK